MSKGSAPAGNTTTQTVNPTAQAQLPFLQDYWSGLKTAYNNNPQSYYPGQTLADFVPTNQALTQGYQNLASTGTSLDDWLRPAANSAWGALAGGGAGYANSPAYGGYQSYATGQSAPQQQYQSYGAQAAGPNVGTNALAQAAQGQGMGLNALAKTASGAYLNSNPYLDATYRMAADPVTRSYQTATAPTADAAFSGGGRYGSGASAGARDTNELNLGNTLQNLSTNIYGGNYARERAAQDAAAGNYTTLTNQAANAYGTLTNQGLDTALRAAQSGALAQQYGLSGLSNAFNTGNTALQNAASLYPALANAQLIGPNAQVTAGQGLNAVDQSYRTFQQAQIDDTIKRYNANQAQPWTNLNMYGAGLGAAVPGSSNVTSPYFQNQLASTLSGITGGLGIANQLGGSGGLLSGLGGSAAANTGIAGLTDFGGGGAALGIADTGFAAPLAADAGATAAGGGFLDSLFSFLPFLSDRRLKEDDNVVGNIGELPLHEFRYKGDPVKRIGFMADEVSKIDPGAVIDTDSGYQAVNYGRAFGSALNSMMSRKA